MNKVKRSLVVTTISVAALVGTVGCTAAPVASGPVEIEYLGWVPGLQDSVDLWNSENPDIQVKLTTSTGSAEANPAIRAGVQAGNAPCMAQMAYFSLPNFVADGLLMPITDVASQYESQFLDWTWKAASAGGEVYVPTVAEKATFKAAVAPVMDWFKANVKGGPEVLTSFETAVAKAQGIVDTERASDLQ